MHKLIYVVEYYSLSTGQKAGQSLNGRRATYPGFSCSIHNLSCALNRGIPCIALIQVHKPAHEMKVLTFVFQKILGVAAGEECPPFLQLFLLCVPLCLLALYQSLSVRLKTKYIRHKSTKISHKYFSLIDTGDIMVVAGSCSALGLLLVIYLGVGVGQVAQSV